MQSMPLPDTVERNGKRILVVEDDPLVSASIAGELRKNGYQCAEVATGARARNAVAHSRPDLMLLDLGLPDGDGVELLKELRASDPLPVIVISGRDTETDRIRGLDLGADDYITKPFSPREVSSRVTSVLRRSEVSPSRSILRFGDVKIDVNAHEVRKNEKTVSLTAKEFDLLVCLARQPRTVFSRSDLLREVWANRSGQCSEATVTEHVRRLRLKLEENPSSPRHLCAVRGVGYRLVP